MADNAVNVPMLIGGAWREGGGHTERRDPYRGGVVARVPEATPGLGREAARRLRG